MTTTQPSLPVSEAARHDRFDEGVRTLRVGRTAVKLEERLLMVIGGILAPVGVIVVLLGWVGASRTPHVFEQVPYLISGGLLGVALVFLGAFFYFAHWLTQLVKEHREQSQQLVAAVAQLSDEVRSLREGRADRLTSPSARLVATGRGTMAHRESCTVVAGKADRREVRADDGLSPCKLCDPYGD